ncbi:MAG: hypothetical protein H7326_05075 [Bdellovibrionaceae bacterium]|nr:hypothetical protein [Pseudobdellovibrionaceae bacterium]
MKKLIFALCLLTNLNAANAERILPTLIPIMGIMTSSNGIHIQVASGGCTSKKNFAIRKDQTTPFVVFGIYRLADDPCLALLRSGVVLTYTYEELGLERGTDFLFQNPLAFSRAY